MKLFLLRPVEAGQGPKDNNPWNPWFDKSFGHIVRAENEQQARELVIEHSGDEKRELENDLNPWLDSKYSTCVELTADGIAEHIMVDFASA